MFLRTAVAWVPRAAACRAMAGHSKWHNIKHAKAAEDERRSKIFQKLFREIVSAARTGGPNPAVNARIAKAIENAKIANMPKKNIEVSENFKYLFRIFFFFLICHLVVLIPTECD